MLIRYQLPCSYSFLSQVNSSQEVCQSLCGVISKNSIEEVVHANLILMKLHFKKFMLLEPRYFHYLKYLNSSGSSHWEICVSTKAKHHHAGNEKEC